MTHIEIPIQFTDSYFQLKSMYDNIENEIRKKEGIIYYKDYRFHNYIGDITTNINWTWAVSNESFSVFEIFLKDKIEIINKYFKNNFYIRGCSFITLYEKEVKDTDFHFDITSHYDTPDSTNAITLIFPLYIEEDMGNLEYKEGGETSVYKYYKDKMLIWDACKLEHRTEPYSLSEKKKRVLVSMNLSTEEEWAEKNVINSLKCQGNITF